MNLSLSLAVCSQWLQFNKFFMLFVPTSPFTEKQDFLASHPCGPGADIIHYGSLQDKQKCHFSPGRSRGEGMWLCVTRAGVGAMA